MHSPGWNLVLKFLLRQMPASERTQMTAIERRLFAFCDKYGFDYSAKKSIFPFESLRSDLSAYKSAVFNGFQSGWKPKSVAKEVKYRIEDGGYLKVADSGNES